MILLVKIIFTKLCTELNYFVNMDVIRTVIFVRGEFVWEFR
jgi:hypothetical protein